MISEGEWASIAAMVQRIVGHGGKDHFMSATVIKRDVANKTVWVKELGDQAVPVVAHTMNVKYYDTDNSGVINVKNAVVAPAVPNVGDHIFIVFEMGSQSLPRCIGVVHGTNWVASEDETGFGDV